MDFLPLATHPLSDNNTWTDESVALPLEAEDSCIDIRFWTDVSTSSEGARIDDVKVCAEVACDPCDQQVPD